MNTRDEQTETPYWRALNIGVQPAQLEAPSAELHLTPEHHMLVLSAGTPVSMLQRQFTPGRITRIMTGLAVAGGQSAVSVFSGSEFRHMNWRGR